MKNKKVLLIAHLTDVSSIKVLLRSCYGAGEFGLYVEGFFSKQKVSSLGNAINPTFSKGESSEIISLTVPSTYIILIHEPKFFFLEQNL